MKRTLASDTISEVHKEAKLAGWVQRIRSLGKIAFFDLRDRSGIIQVSGLTPQSAKMIASLNQQDVVEVVGKIKKREEKYVNKNSPLGSIEIEAEKISLIAKAEEVPFDLGGEDLKLELPTLLDHRAVSLRHPKVQAIFRVQEVIIDSFREFLKKEGFFEFQSPSIAPAVAEGGAEVFEIDYFGHKAYLTQSPQLYKQIVMSGFERVFSVNKIFRAEPSVTTRHLAEIISLDAEMGFIDSWEDVKEMAERCVKFILQRVEKECQYELNFFKASLPHTIDKTPTISLTEAQERIFKNSGRDVRGEKDLNPEDEKEISEIIKKETESDFVFVYGYPTKHKPFYVYPNPENPEFNEGMDLLCRGLEWLSGGRRINDYKQLIKHVEQWGMDPNKVAMFLEAFKYGVPPEGGFALGAERMTMQILGLANIREASLFPRDMDRVDERFSKEKKQK